MVVLKETVQKYSFIPLSIALVLSLFYGFQPDPTHNCVIEETSRYCFDISGGLHTRCYLDVEKSTWDYCKGGWVAVADWAPITSSEGVEYKLVDGDVEVWEKTKSYKEKQITSRLIIIEEDLENILIDNDYWEKNFYPMCVKECPTRCEFTELKENLAICIDQCFK